MNQNCAKRNVVYETWCQNCQTRDESCAVQRGEDPKEIPLYNYIGESCRSCYERGGDHQNDAANWNKSSHILKHILDKHEEESAEDIVFRMRAIKFHQSAYTRHIHEAVAIQSNRSHHILNSKSEFNRCVLPRLSLKMGDKDIKER